MKRVLGRRLLLVLASLGGTCVLQPARLHAEVRANGGSFDRDPTAVVVAPATPAANGAPSPVPIRSIPNVSDGTLVRPAGMSRSEKSPAAAAAPSPWPTILASLCVVGLVVVAAKWWRKHGPKLNGGLPDEVLESLGRRPLDARQSIHLVRIGHRILVLGSSPDGLRPLAEIDDPVEVDYLSGLCRRARDENAVGETFRALFRRRDESPGERGVQPVTPPANRVVQSPATSAPPSARPARGEVEPPPGDDDLRRRLSERMRSGPTTVPGEVSR